MGACAQSSRGRRESKHEGSVRRLGRFRSGQRAPLHPQPRGVRRLERPARRVAGRFCGLSSLELRRASSIAIEGGARSERSFRSDSRARQRCGKRARTAGSCGAQTRERGFDRLEIVVSTENERLHAFVEHPASLAEARYSGSGGRSTAPIRILHGQPGPRSGRMSRATPSLSRGASTKRTRRGTRRPWRGAATTACNH